MLYDHEYDGSEVIVEVKDKNEKLHIINLLLDSYSDEEEEVSISLKTQFETIKYRPC